MDNPVLVEVTRGAQIESGHRATAAVVDVDGATVLALGETERPVFPRSAVKPLQALPLVEGGVADAFGLEDAEIALACASHGGEPVHVETAAAMLRKAERDEGCLECGAHWPLAEAASRALAAGGREPGPLHNNCSGKHAGFICLACGLDHDPKGYVKPEHPVQQAVRACLEDLTGARHSEDVRGVDGCSIPTYAVPLSALALAFARFGAGAGLSRSREAAARRIRRSVAGNPIMLSGTGRFDTRLTEALGMRLFIKSGAEAVHCAALPELGLGIAVKADDGGKRAAEVIIASLIHRFLPLDGGARAVIRSAMRRDLTNWNGIVVGEIRPAGPLAAELQEARMRRRSRPAQARS